MAQSILNINYNIYTTCSFSRRFAVISLLKDKDLLSYYWKGS